MADTTLLELADRCERAEGRDMQLGHEILVAVGQRHKDAVEGFGYPAEHMDPTASIDAALTLVNDREAEFVLEEALHRIRDDGWMPGEWLKHYRLYVVAAALRARATQDAPQ